MSVTDLPIPKGLSDPVVSRGAGGGVFLRVFVVCALLLGSGALRAWQERRIQGTLDAGRRATVNLESVPMTLGPWQGATQTMDSEIARGTGADQVVTRRYTNRNTGVSIDVIFLFGPAVHMFIHAPDVCYPKAGFSAYQGPDFRTIPAGQESVPFASVIYAKGAGERADFQEVFWTWRYNGRWTPSVLNMKQTERVPSMIKVHTARRVLPGERRAEERRAADLRVARAKARAKGDDADTPLPEPFEAENPSESFLKQLMPEVEKLVTGPPST